MARHWKRATFVAVSIFITKAASVFTGSVTGEDGSVSLTFSSGTPGEGSRDIVLRNTLFSDQRSLNVHDLHGVRTETKGSRFMADGSYVRWDASISGEAAITAAFANSAGPNNITFGFAGTPRFYGIWEYPWNKSITNNHYGANLTASTAEEQSKGVPTSDIGIYGTQPGINWCNARAPYFFTDNGYGVYVDTQTPFTFGTHEVEGGTQVVLETSETNVTYTILYTQTDIKTLLRRFAKLSSYPLMPPDTAYGPIFWSDDFEQDFHDSTIRNSQDNINDVANHLDEYKIRATSFFADRPYGSGNWSFGNFDFDPKFYPDPVDFIANLSKRGYDFQVWVANRAFLYTQLFNESSENHWLFPGVDPVQFLGPALNLSIPAAYDYYRTQLSNFVSTTGVRGFKIDRGEEGEMPDAEQNRQQNLFLQLCDEVMQRIWGSGTSISHFSSAYYNFARSAFNTDRSRVGIWNGDSEATFEGLQYSVASGIRAGLLGFSHWGSDTGGYIRDAGGPTEELFARWMHFSAWSPMYEIMIGLNHTPWYQYSPRLVEVLRQTADTHTRLVPYLRSYAHEASTTGVPVIRALFLEFPYDSAAYETNDAYMLGGEFLVAPVLNEGGNVTIRFPNVNKNETSRKFLEYENKTAVFSPGDTHEVVSLPLESTPVYVREGSLVPTGDVYQGNSVGWPCKNESSWSPYLFLEAFPSFDVPETVFSYYRGRESTTPPGITPGLVAIIMTTNRANRTVTFRATDHLGDPASVVVYQKSAKDGKPFSVTLDLPTHNQTLVTTGVYSLFE